VGFGKTWHHDKLRQRLILEIEGKNILIETVLLIDSATKNSSALKGLVFKKGVGTCAKILMEADESKNSNGGVRIGGEANYTAHVGKRGNVTSLPFTNQKEKIFSFPGKSRWAKTQRIPLLKRGKGKGIHTHVEENSLGGIPINRNLKGNEQDGNRKPSPSQRGHSESIARI